VVPLQFFIKIDANIPNAMNNALTGFYSVFNMIEDSKKVFEDINAKKDIRSDRIINAGILNTNLVKLDNLGQSSKALSPIKFKSFNFQK
jgi:hypothetical protein